MNRHDRAVVISPRSKASSSADSRELSFLAVRNASDAQDNRCRTAGVESQENHWLIGLFAGCVGMVYLSAR